MIYGYVRVSTGRQASEGESLATQQRQIEGYALMQGIAITESFIEEGVSGSIPVEDREAGARLFAKLTRGDIVIAAKLDRMFRSALDALQVVEKLKEKGVQLHLLDLGGDVAGNGMSKLFMTIVAAFAEAERARISERQLQAKADQKARGRYLGGIVPFGFKHSDDGTLISDAEQTLARAEILELRGRGQSLRAIASAISARGVAISHVGVANVLKACGVR